MNRNKVRKFLQDKFYSMLSELDAITDGFHPIWDKPFSDALAEIVLQIIIIGNLSERE
jgi:hypothetical protein